jgi:Beta propeller domain
MLAVVLLALAQPPRRLTAFASDGELSTYLHQLTVARSQPATCPECITLLSDSLLTAPADSAFLVGGRVSSGGKPVSAAVVTIAGIPGGTTTDADGSFRLLIPISRQHPGDSLTLTIRRLGYGAATYRFLPRAGRAIALAIALSPALLQLDAVAVAGQAAAMPARSDITNNQSAGVDEGDIVKQHGDQLVILRRGRLFSVALGGNALVPISAINAFGPGMDPEGTWYDELLVSGDQLVVIGYSYSRGGTEVGLFHIDSRGHITYRSTYQLRSSDYYSSRNYASRLIGSTLVFYSPLSALPAFRRWRTDSSRFERTATVQRIYHPAREWNGEEGVAFHTVTTCQLGDGDMTCEATVVVGPPERSFYVSSTAVYIWTTGTLYRMPLDGAAPSAVGVAGQPVDQFSFLESGDGYINVLVRSDAQGDAMWRPEYARGTISLFRFALRDLGDGSQSAPLWRYRPLPDVDNGELFQNRFVGDYLLYGTERSPLTVVPWRGGDLSQLALGHATERIEVMGRDAVVIGAHGNDLLASGIRLDGSPRVLQRLTIPEASQGELRSHGFFYRPDGIIGLPVLETGRARYQHLVDGSAGVLFVRNDGHRFTRLGTLDAGQARHADDACQASCVDWYGNARPLFVGDRVFALLGYELVEGSLGWDSIDEVRRVNFGPRGARIARD